MECPTSDLEPIAPTRGHEHHRRFLVNRNLVPASSVTPDLIRKAVDFPWLSVATREFLVDTLGVDLTHSLGPEVEYDVDSTAYALTEVLGGGWSPWRARVTRTPLADDHVSDGLGADGGLIHRRDS
jgi:hypothetical protein